MPPDPAPDAPTAPRDPRRLARLALGAALVVLGVAALWVVPLWGLTLFDSLVPRRAQRRLTIGLLEGVLVAEALVVIVAPPLAAWLAARIVRARRRRQRRPGAARWLLLCASCLLGVALLEGLAAAWEASVPPPPTAPRPVFEGSEVYPTTFPDEDPSVLDVVVLGGSSATGSPFHDWLSVGHILAWQLGEANPGRPGRVAMLAKGGHCLEQMHEPLKELRRKPEVLVIYSGHNEFQARFHWFRNVNYYDDDFSEIRAEGLAEAVSRRTPLGRLVLGTVDRRRVALPPPPRVTRTLVDRPAYTLREYADILSLFRRRLESFVVYAESIGAVPVLVLPPGNEVGYEPSRSFLARGTSEAERAAFAADFRAARRLEETDPVGAEAAYRALLARQPTFAETHYRLAVLCQKAGDVDEARRRYRRARNLDGMPLRCLDDFEQVYRDLAAAHPSAILVDGPAVLGRLKADGLLDDRLIHDAHHPALRSHIALAQEALDRGSAQGAPLWPVAGNVPRIDPDACAAHFGLRRGDWAEVCEGLSTFYDRTAYIRFDPSLRLAKRDRFLRGARAVAGGAAPEASGVPGLGTHPEGLRPPEAVRSAN